MTKRVAGKVTPRRRRAPDATRQALLLAAFEEIHRHGYQSASLDAILARAGVTKGALYHHFPDKAALGHAVITELIHGHLMERWLGPLKHARGDALERLKQVFRCRAGELGPREIELGCPLNNLAQEMSPLDERFRCLTETSFSVWRRGFAAELRRGQAEGTVRRDVDPARVAAFLVAAAEGSFGLAKNAGSPALLRHNMELLADYLETLRADTGAPVSRRGARAVESRRPRSTDR